MELSKLLCPKCGSYEIVVCDDGSPVCELCGLHIRTKRWGQRPIIGTSIIGKMAVKKVFYVFVNPSRHFVCFVEGHDGYFDLILTKDDLKSLAAELLAITETMQ